VYLPLPNARSIRRHSKPSVWAASRSDCRGTRRPGTRSRQPGSARGLLTGWLLAWYLGKRYNNRRPKIVTVLYTSVPGCYDMREEACKYTSPAPLKGAGNILPRGMMPLGFGCGPLGIGLSSAESVRLLQTAIDCGITYFDTARMYGWGRAEGILGELTPRNRDGIIVASKAGILPPDRSLPRRIISRGVRLLHEAAPKTKRYIAGPEVWQPRYGVFRVPELRKSVETSLKELRTDYLDIFLLHECKEPDVQDSELLDFLQGLKTQGKIRAFGIATGIEETIAITRMRPVLASVLQIPNNIWEANMARLPAKPDALTITHSCFGGRFRGLQSRLSSDASLARDWKSMTHVDPHDASTMAQLILAHALRANAGGIVLFSSSKPANIVANARAVEDNVIQDAQIDGLDAFMARKVM